MAQLRYLSGTNGYVPRTTGQLIAYARDPRKFKINNYVQYIPTEKRVGIYYELGRDEYVRVPTDEEFAWEQGLAAPMGVNHKVPFKAIEFATFRRSYPYTMGYDEADQNEWRAKEAYAQAAMTKCMTNRTWRTITALETSANWPTGHVATATALGGGLWGAATDDPAGGANYLSIKKTINEVMLAIDRDTNNSVDWLDVQMILSPVAATNIAETAEYHNYLRAQPGVEAMIRDNKNPNMFWGLPPSLYGVPLVIENAVRVSTHALATGVEAAIGAGRDYIKSSNSAVFTSRPGGLDGAYGGPSYSTVQIYHYKGLAMAQEFRDDINERIIGRVQENIAVKLPATYAGYLVTNLFS